MKRGKTTISKLKKYSVFSILVFLAVLICVNLGASWLEEQAGLTADMTDNQLYSLSGDTKRELDQLDQTIDIYSVSMPYGENEMIQAVLSAYGAASDKIALHIIHPNMSQRTLEELGLSSDSMAQGNFVVVTNGDRSRYRVIYEEDMFLQDSSGENISLRAEMKVTSAIRYVSTGVVQKIKLLAGHMETPTIQLTELLNLLDMTNSQVELCQLADDDATLDPQNDILLAIAPKTDLEEAEYEKLSEFLAQGGNAIFMMSRAETDETASATKIYLNDMDRFNHIFARYGIQLNQDMIMSSDLNAVSIDAATISMVIADHPICEGIDETVVLSQCSSLNVTDGAEIILSTSEQSYAKQLSADITTLKKEAGDAEGPFGVVAVGRDEEADSTIVVYSSASLVQDGALALEGNKKLLLNTVDYAWERDDSLDIANKELGGTWDMDIQRTVVAAVCIAFIPLLAVAAGIWIITGRNKKRS